MWERRIDYEVDVIEPKILLKDVNDEDWRSLFT